MNRDAIRPARAAQPRKVTALAVDPLPAEPVRRSNTLLIGLISFGVVGGLLLVIGGLIALLTFDQWTTDEPKKSRDVRTANASAARKDSLGFDSPIRTVPSEKKKSNPNPSATRNDGLEEAPSEEASKRPSRPNSAAQMDARPARATDEEDLPRKSKKPKKELEENGETAKEDDPAKKESAPSLTNPQDESAKADPSPADAPRRLSGDQIYRRLVKSSVFIFTGDAWGSGSLVHRDKRLILTNYHVVGENGTVAISFPRHDTNGKLIVDGEYYFRAFKAGEFLKGTVVKVAKGKDLALVQLDRVPEGTPVLKLSARGARPGQAVHSVGNPGASDARWSYTSGTVRQLSHKTWRARLDRRTILTFDADVVETQSPTNHGDSGGPLVNDALELVAVTQGAITDAREVSLFIDVAEVKKLLEEYGLPLTEVVAAPSDRMEGGALENADLVSLVKHLEDKDANLRAEAAKRLGELGPDARSAARPLMKALTDEEASVRRNAAHALGQLGSDARDLVRKDVFAVVRDVDPDVRLAALEALASLGQPDEDELPTWLTLLRQSARRRDKKSALHITRSLAHLGTEAKEAVADLRTLLKIEDRELRIAVVTTLRKIGPNAREAAPDLVEILKDTDRSLRLPAAFALTAIDPRMTREGREALNVLVLAVRPESAAEFRDAQWKERVKDITALLVKVGEPAAQSLMRAIKDEFRPGLRGTESTALNEIARVAAIRIIATIGKDAYSPGLVSSLAELSRSDPAPLVRKEAREAFPKVQKN